MIRNALITKNFPLFLFGVLLLIATFIFLKDWLSQNNTDLVKIEINNDATLKLEVADTDYLRSKGLMYREELEEDRGMLFIFDDLVKNGFWMKNTLIPLDMIFIDPEGKIVEIFENVPPCKVTNCESYTPEKMYKYVIELNGGSSEELDIQLGDEILSEDIITQHQ